MKLDQARGDRRGAKLSRDHSSANMKITEASSISVIIEVCYHDDGYHDDAYHDDGYHHDVYHDDGYHDLYLATLFNFNRVLRRLRTSRSCRQECTCTVWCLPLNLLASER